MQQSPFTIIYLLIGVEVRQWLIQMNWIELKCEQIKGIKTIIGMQAVGVLCLDQKVNSTTVVAQLSCIMFYLYLPVLIEVRRRWNLRMLMNLIELK